MMVDVRFVVGRFCIYLAGLRGHAPQFVSEFKQFPRLFFLTANDLSG